MDGKKAKRMLSEFNVIEHSKRRLVSNGYALFEEPIEERCPSVMKDLKLIDSKILKIEKHSPNEVLVYSVFPLMDAEPEVSYNYIKKSICDFIKQNYTFPIVEIESIETEKEEDVVLNLYKITSRVVLNFYETDLIDMEEIEGVIEIMEIAERLNNPDPELFAYNVCANRYDEWKEQGEGISLHLWYLLNYGE